MACGESSRCGCYSATILLTYHEHMDEHQFIDSIALCTNEKFQSEVDSMYAQMCCYYLECLGISLSPNLGLVWHSLISTVCVCDPHRDRQDRPSQWLGFSPKDWLSILLRRC
jgi:hypothetical protein